MSAPFFPARVEGGTSISSTPKSCSRRGASRNRDQSQYARRKTTFPFSRSRSIAGCRSKVAGLIPVLVTRFSKSMKRAMRLSLSLTMISRCSTFPYDAALERQAVGASMSAAVMRRRRIGDPALASRLGQVLRGEVLFDAFTRGRYSTDASIYQIEPIGVALPEGTEDVEAAIAIAREEGFPVIPRGGGSSQNGQTLGEAVVLDTSRHMNRVLEVDPVAGTAAVQPGIVLDELNRQLKQSGWYFPVDVSTSANATIGGMTGNNSAGTRSIKYGIMVHNVLEVEAVLADASRIVFGELPGDLTGSPG